MPLNQFCLQSVSAGRPEHLVCLLRFYRKPLVVFECTANIAPQAPLSPTKLERIKVRRT